MSGKVKVNNLYVPLAICPMPNYEFGNGYRMYDCILSNKNKLVWRPRKVEYKQAHFRAEIYEDLKTAIENANEYNKKTESIVNDLGLSDVEANSLFLRVDKFITCMMRIVSEEHLMLKEAIENHKDTIRPAMDSIKIDKYTLAVKEELYKKLQETPYIKIARINKYGVTLLLENDTWFPIKHTKVTAKFAYRDRIAAGFGFDFSDDWRKIKSTIRTLLLPRANKLLQLASVKRMLDDAYRDGKKVLVLGSYVFWYEDKNSVGWKLKEVNSDKSTQNGNSLWVEGKIVSRNHGRIVVLPYIKENGEKVLGHTKNSAHDGKALPRHEDEYLELPFEILQQDLVIGLFGELYYE
ncbi:hypothetical protein ID106_18590 [Vibrio cholerae]|uniref:hypothetical protein n=1 Tax=Vibrio cholerae TaxID=666 RepID=UPI002B3E1BA1|nr:hypothetical protein [Vibrio cholerae]